jgi:hypothetical protein
MVKDIGSLVTDSHTPPVAGWILNSRVASAAVLSPLDIIVLISA